MKAISLPKPTQPPSVKAASNPPHSPADIESRLRQKMRVLPTARTLSTPKHTVNNYQS